MKKIILTVSMLALLLLTACGKQNGNQVKEKFLKDVEKLNSYYMEGELKLTNNDDTYNYDLEISYSKDDNFKVKMVNKANKYEQTILRNKEAVYVITPAINKNFKFQSEWPYNNSQAYLLNSVAKDLKDDKTATYESKDGQHIFTSKVNYPNNPQLEKQQIILDKNYDLNKVVVLDRNNTPYIEFKVTSFDKKAKFKNDYFEYQEEAEVEENKTQDDKDKNTENNVTDNNNNTKESNDQNCNSETGCKNDKNVSKIDEALFPLYLPTNTKLSNKEVISTDTGQRVIMTFEGDSPFILVQETASKEPTPTIIPTYGEPFILVDTVGSLTDISYTWTSGGIEYYIVSDVMSQNELLEVAKSINLVSVINEK